VQQTCDTEDWSNDAENSALNTGINYIYITFRKQLFRILNKFSIAIYIARRARTAKHWIVCQNMFLLPGFYSAKSAKWIKNKWTEANVSARCYLQFTLEHSPFVYIAKIYILQHYCFYSNRVYSKHLACSVH